MKNPTIISLGGSLIVPQEIDVNFLKAFRDLILDEVASGKSFVIITGGGKVCRKYQDASRELGSNDQENLDWIGIYATRLNASLLSSIFHGKVHSGIIIHPDELNENGFPIAVGAGGIPGHSSDYDAVLLAEKTGAKRVINLSNIDYVYEKDPREFPEAKKIEKSNWKDFRAILPKEWTPGVNAPFDPIAAGKAEELGLEVAIMNGKNLENLKKCIDGEKFIGTLITK